jgi:hypothetical protein
VLVDPHNHYASHVEQALLFTCVSHDSVFQKV